MRDHEVALSQLTVVVSPGFVVKASGKLGRLGEGPGEVLVAAFFVPFSLGFAVAGPLRRDQLEGLGSPIKRLSVKGKNFPEHENLTSCFAAFGHRHPYHCRYFSMLRCQPSLHQSPIRIKAVVEVVEVSTALSAFRGPENLRYQAVSKWLFQDSWLLASPLVVHGVGSNDKGLGS